MAESAKKIPLVAVDSNLLLDRANDDELVLDALETVRKRLTGAEFIVTPTVIDEVVFKAEHEKAFLDRRFALLHRHDVVSRPMHN